MIFDHLENEDQRLAKITENLQKCPDTALWVIYQCFLDEFLQDEVMYAMRQHFTSKGLLVDPYDNEFPVRGL